MPQSWRRPIAASARPSPATTESRSAACARASSVPSTTPRDVGRVMGARELGIGRRLRARACDRRRSRPPARAAPRTCAWESDAPAEAAARSGRRSRCSISARRALLVWAASTACLNGDDEASSSQRMRRPRCARGRRNRRSRRRSRRSPTACSECVATGRSPRASLCRPWAPPSKRAMPLLDAELDRLVIARFEVQAGHVLGHAPVAAPQRFAACRCRAPRTAGARRASRSTSMRVLRQAPRRSPRRTPG